MNRWLPVGIILLVVAGVVLLLGPGVYRGMLFKRDSRVLLDTVSAGDLATAIAQIEVAQQAAIGTLVTTHVPVGYEQQIASLRLTSWEQQEPGTIWAIVTLRLEDASNVGLYQGKLHWTYDSAARRWWWDFLGSYAAQYSPSGEPRWEPLTSAVQLAGEL